MKESEAPMYTGKHAHLRPLQPAFIMASTGEAVTYRELDARSNRLAHLFRKRGLKRLDHYSIFMENNSRYLEACGAGERSGFYYTCVNSYLTAGELAYILTNSQSRILITSKLKLDVAREALKECPKVELCIVADGDGRKRAHRRPAARPRRACRRRRSRTNASAPRCSIRPAPPAGRRAFCGRCRSSRPTQQLPLFDFLENSGTTARA